MRNKELSIALSANGFNNVGRGPAYEEAFSRRRVDVLWAIPPDLVKYSSHIMPPRAEYEENRRAAIRQAAALVVINTVEVSEEPSGLPFMGNDIVRGRFPLGQESETDMTMAYALGKPIYMPEGFPTIRQERQIPTAYGSPECLEGLGVVVAPPSELNTRSAEEYVGFILRDLASRAAAMEV